MATMWELSMLFNRKPNKYIQELLAYERQANINFLNWSILDLKKEFVRLGLTINEANNLFITIHQVKKTMLKANLTQHSFDHMGAKVTLHGEYLKLVIPHNGRIEL